MYSLRLTDNYKKSRDKIVKRDKIFAKRLHKVLKLLVQNPQHKSLNSHKVETRKYGARWSSWVTGDKRLIWDYDSKNRVRLLVLDLGGHSGKNKVYS